jgi:hypothetical protein
LRDAHGHDLALNLEGAVVGAAGGDDVDAVGREPAQRVGGEIEAKGREDGEMLAMWEYFHR